MENETKNEVGRELTAYDLVLLCGITPVILSREDRPYAYTVWVSRVTPEFVVFLAGEVKTTFIVTLIVTRHPDGTMTDDSGQRIRVFEYLGEI
jgi:hypothetical protein